MTDVRKQALSLLEEKPELEPVLREILRVDSDGTWEFDNISADSGTFGEIVSRGLVEDTDDGYRVTDRDALRSALSDSEDESSDSEDVQSRELPSFDRPNRFVVVAFGAVLAVVIAVRVGVPFQSVFREQDVVLLGNDPYKRLYWTETLVSNYDFLSFAWPDALPLELRKSDLLMVLTMWALTALLGGSVDGAASVLAVYPVVSAVITAVLLYYVAMLLTKDRRVALASVLVLAFVPAHGYRTALGFGDHHAFDYLLLTITTVLLLRLSQSHFQDETTAFRDVPWQTWALTVGLSVSLAAQTLAWLGSPLVLLPVGLLVIVQGTLALRAGRSPLRETAHILVGFAGAGAFTVSLHLLFQWLQPFRVFTPVAGFGLASAVISILTLAERRDVSARVALGIQILALAVVAGILLFATTYFDQAIEAFATQFQTGGIAETLGLFSDELGAVLGPLLFYGLFLVVSLPVLLLHTKRFQSEYRPRWSLVVTFTWYFVVLSLVQVRFAGMAAIYISLFAGITFVYVASKIDIVRPVDIFGDQQAPETLIDRQIVPSLTTSAHLLVLFLLVFSLAIVQTPIKQQQLAVSEQTYQTASWIDRYADEHGMTYPDNYVFTEWSKNRVYNYFVNGESESYDYAQENFESFLQTLTPEQRAEWYHTLADRAGFIVVDSVGTSPDSATERTTYDLLSTHPTRADSPDTLEHYRLRFAHHGSHPLVYEIVPGATVTGSAAPNDTVRVRTEVTVPGANFTYLREVATTANGQYAFRAPYAGTYTQVGTERTVDVTDHEIRNDEFAVPTRSRAEWSFTAGHGTIAFDTRGGNHARIHDAEWTDGVNGTGLQFDGSGYAQVRDDASLVTEESFTTTVWFKTRPNIDYRNERVRPHILADTEGGSFLETDGLAIALRGGRLQVAVGDGEHVATVRGPHLDDDNWHHVAVIRNRSSIRVYLDGERVGTSSAPISEAGLVNDVPLTVGATSSNRSNFVGRIDQVSYYNTTVTEKNIQEQYENATKSG